MSNDLNGNVDNQGRAAYRYDDKLPPASEMLADLLKATEIHELFDSYYNLITIPVAIIDLNANVLLSSRWQRICTQFHRVHPITCRRCIDCDTKLATQLEKGKTYTIYRCRNGLTDCASPILIEGKHIANVFIGQFLTAEPDEVWFRRQAEEFGFDVVDYLAAAREVPVVNAEKIPVILDLLVRMTRVITTLSIDRKSAVENRSRQEIILNTIPQAVFWKDLEGKYLGCNTSFARAAGLATPEDIVGKTDFDLPWPKEEAEAYRSDDQAVITSNKPRLHIEEPIQKADGSRIIADTSKIPLVDAENIPYGVVGVYEDITERKRAEDARRESERKYRELVENANSIILRWTRDGDITFMNEFGQRFFGYTEEEIIGRHLVGTIVPEFESAGRDLRGLMKDISLHTKGYEQNVNENIRRNGERVWISWNNKVVLDEQGQVKELLSIGYDISDRKKAAEELKKAAEEWSTTFNSTTDMFMLIDKDYRISKANKAMAEFLQLPAEKIIGRYWHELIHESRVPLSECPLFRLQQSARHEDSELYLKELDTWLQVTVDPVLDEEGELLGAVHMLKDITEQKRLEQQLRHAQKMEAVGTLAGGIAHDFNNILTAIIGFGHLLQMKMPPDNELRFHVTQILSAAERAANLTRSLLAFSRKQPIETRATDLNSIISGLEKILRRLVREDITVVMNLSQESLTVMADPGQLEQVLINLTTNAGDAISGKGTITFSSGKIDLDELSAEAYGIGEPGTYAVITFSDNGIGMTEDIRRRIFEPFFTTKAINKGTGLGLSICFGIIKQHKGYISCYSEPGIGTTFRIYLPLISGKPEEVHAKQSVPLMRGTETVLVAEDDAMVRNYISGLLKEFGYTVILARDGDEMMAIFDERSKEIDLLLLDVIMPKRNGCEVLAEIRPNFPDLPAIFFSGHQPEVFRHQIQSLEGVEFVAKPVAPGDLLRKVREVLDQASN